MASQYCFQLEVYTNFDPPRLITKPQLSFKYSGLDYDQIRANDNFYHVLLRLRLSDSYSALTLFWRIARRQELPYMLLTYICFIFHLSRSFFQIRAPFTLTIPIASPGSCFWATMCTFLCWSCFCCSPSSWSHRTCWLQLPQPVYSTW